MKKFTIKVYDNETGELVTDPEAAITETGGYFLLAQHGNREKTTGVCVKTAIDSSCQDDGNRNAFIAACFQAVISPMVDTQEDFVDVLAFTIQEFLRFLEKRFGLDGAAQMCLHMAEQLAKKAVEAGEAAP